MSSSSHDTRFVQFWQALVDVGMSPRECDVEVTQSYLAYDFGGLAIFYWDMLDPPWEVVLVGQAGVHDEIPYGGDTLLEALTKVSNDVATWDATLAGLSLS